MLEWGNNGTRKISQFITIFRGHEVYSQQTLEICSKLKNDVNKCVFNFSWLFSKILAVKSYAYPDAV